MSAMIGNEIVRSLCQIICCLRSWIIIYDGKKQCCWIQVCESENVFIIYNMGLVSKLSQATLGLYGNQKQQ